MSERTSGKGKKALCILLFGICMWLGAGTTRCGKNVTTDEDTEAVVQTEKEESDQEAGSVGMMEEAGDIIAENISETEEDTGLEIDVQEEKRSSIVSEWIRSESEYQELAELFQHHDCKDISIRIDNDSASEYLLGVLADSFSENPEEGKTLVETAEEEHRYLGGVYRLRRNGYCYTACVLKNEDMDEHPHVFLYIEEEDGAADGYFDRIEIPAGAETEIWAGTDQKIRLFDVNFDGYEDLNFAGEADFLQSWNYYRFLWNPVSEKYEWSETAPTWPCDVDTERKRMTHYARLSGAEGTYYIYTYTDGEFFEQALREALSDITTGWETRWEYYEEGELLESLVVEYEDDERINYTFTGRDGRYIEGVFLKDENRNWKDLRLQFFPEFDFFNFG